MFRKLMLVFSTLALGVASAASVYHVTISDPTWVGTTELKPGDYSVEMQGDKAVMKSGKNVVEVPARMETDASKHASTELITNTAGGKTKLEQIMLRGSKDKIVLNPGQ